MFGALGRPHGGTPMPRARALFVASLALLFARCGKDEGRPASPPSSPPASGGGMAAPAAGAAAGYGYAANLGDDLDRKVGDAMVKGKKLLLGKRDEKTGAWPGHAEAGSTALVTTSIVGTLAREVVKDDPVVKKALDYLVSKQREDGAISSNPQFVNYET